MPQAKLARREELRGVETEIAKILQNFSPKELDPVTKQRGLKTATLRLLQGTIDVPEWRWHVVTALNEEVDLPYLLESTEKKMFNGAFHVAGEILQGAVLGKYADKELRDATIDLLSGEQTVPEWIDVVGEVLANVVNVPYVPQVGEDMLFDKGLEIIGKTLHGLLKGGSKQ